MTAHPYLGLGRWHRSSASPAAHGRGLLVVARSSNPEGRALQQAVTAEGTAVEDMLLAEVAALNGSPDVPTGTVGAVVGATLEPSEFALSQLGGVILAPGLGAQGAGPGRRGRAVRRVPAGQRPAEQLAWAPAPRSGPRRAARAAARSLARELSAAMG